MATAGAQSGLLSLPNQVLQGVLLRLPFEILDAAARTCTALRQRIWNEEFYEARAALGYVESDIVIVTMRRLGTMVGGVRLVLLRTNLPGAINHDGLLNGTSTSDGSRLFCAAVSRNASYGAVYALDFLQDSWKKCSWRRFATAVPDRKLFCFEWLVGGLVAVGGLEGPQSDETSTITRLDEASDTWAPLPASMTTGKYLAASGVIDGVLYVAGGCDPGDSLNCLEIFDSATGTWRLGPDLPGDRMGALGLVLDQKFFVIGGTIYGVPGDAIYVYDPDSNSWTIEANPFPVLQLQGGCVREGRIVLFDYGSPPPYDDADDHGADAGVYERYGPDSWRRLDLSPQAKEVLSNVYPGYPYEVAAHTIVLG